ncbi:MAG: RsmB/NOP family class I SAM-dependent RNA methyltransferase [Sphingomonas sp.]|nr:RsmB/NOP family class I SAM-dependent RNA methyltransferase [Sphingomonas sp.]
MTPAARLQAAIEILDEVIASARDDGPPADIIVTRYFKARRYAGSGDRRAVRELVFRAIRRSAERPESGRAAMLVLADDDPGLLEYFGQIRGPGALADGEAASPAAAVPGWLEDAVSPLIERAEWPALLERAPLDLRVNAARAGRDEIAALFPAAAPTGSSPWGLRLPPDTRVDDHPAFLDGLVEVQDEGSQLVALACAPAAGNRIVDLCAGGGGKSLALAAAAPGAKILATDINRSRLSKLAPRAAKAGAAIENRLLDTPRELDGLADWIGTADIVLVDAPCSGSGTWRRNPEGRWRLSPERLQRLVAQQSRLLDIGAELVRPGGRLVYAVCSVLTAEGEAQAANFLVRRSSWVAQATPIDAGRSNGVGRLLVPGQDGTDGFFVARLDRPC